MKTCQKLLGLILLFTVACRAEAWTVKLSEGWHVQSSDKVQGDGAHLSTPGTSTAGWYSATVPSTLMGVLTANGAEPEPLTREDYQHTDRRQFDVSWWYRTTFTIPSQQQGQHTLLQFDGISYRANIWLNGHQIAHFQAERQAPIASSPSTSPPTSAHRTCWPSRCSAHSPEDPTSVSSIGTPDQPTRAWEYSARSASSAAVKCR